VWREHGRALQAWLLLGSRADRREAAALLDSLVVRPVAPPAPPAGWRVVVSGAYDSVRVPPGWRAHALQRVHSTPRPRILFRLVSRSGAVIVRIVEQRRDHGRRFSTRIFARPSAPAREAEWARVAATTFGFAQS
jgi:hypothetical protein